MTEKEFKQYIEDSRLQGMQTVAFQTDNLAIRLGLKNYRYRYMEMVKEANQKAREE